jgi:hypothetical protein
VGVRVTANQNIGAITITPVDELVLDEVERLLRAIYRGGPEDTPLLTLWDWTELHHVPITFHADAVTEFIRQHHPSIPGRTAIVATENFTYGIARMIEGYAVDLRSELHVFRDLAEARRWLAGGEWSPEHEQEWPRS